MKRRSFRRRKQKIIPELNSSSFLSSSGFISNDDTKKTSMNSEHESVCDNKLSSVSVKSDCTALKSYNDDFSDIADNGRIHASQQDSVDLIMEDDRDSDQLWSNISANDNHKGTNDNERDVSSVKEESIVSNKEYQSNETELQHDQNPIKMALIKLYSNTMNMSSTAFEEGTDLHDNSIDNSTYASTYSCTIDDDLTEESKRSWEKESQGGLEEEESLSSFTRNEQNEVNGLSNKFDEARVEMDNSFTSSQSCDEMCSFKPAHAMKLKKRQRSNLKRKHLLFLKKEKRENAKMTSHKGKQIIGRSDLQILPTTIKTKVTKPVYKTNVKIGNGFSFDAVREEVERILEKSSKKANEDDLCDSNISCEDKRSTMEQDIQVNSLEKDNQILPSIKIMDEMQSSIVDEEITNDNKSCANNMFCDSFFQIECLGWRFFKNQEQIPTQETTTKTNMTQTSAYASKTSETNNKPKSENELLTSSISVVESIYRNRLDKEKRNISKQVGWTSSVDVIELPNDKYSKDSNTRLNDDTEKNDLTSLSSNAQYKHFQIISPCNNDSYDKNDAFNSLQGAMKVSKDSSNEIQVVKITTEKMKQGSYDIPTVSIDHDPNVGDRIIMDAFNNTCVC